MISLGIRYNEDELKEKIKQMVRIYEDTSCNINLVGYIEYYEDSENSISFFLAENLLPGKYTTYKINWNSGGLQDTINLVTAQSLFYMYEKIRISVIKEWMQEKYGKIVKQNLRGRWYINDNKEELKCTLSEIEIREISLDKTYELACKEIAEILREWKEKSQSH